MFKSEILNRLLCAPSFFRFSSLCRFRTFGCRALESPCLHSVLIGVEVARVVQRLIFCRFSKFAHVYLRRCRESFISRRCRFLEISVPGSFQSFNPPLSAGTAIHCTYFNPTQRADLPHPRLIPPPFHRMPGGHLRGQGRMALLELFILCSYFRNF